MAVDALDNASMSGIPWLLPLSRDPEQDRAGYTCAYGFFYGGNCNYSDF